MPVAALTISNAEGASLGLKVRRHARRVGKMLQLLPSIGENTLLIFTPVTVKEEVNSTPSSLKYWPDSLVDPLSLAGDADNAKAVAGFLKQAPQDERRIISAWLKGTLSSLADSEHGSLVVQAALGVAVGTDRAGLSAEFRGSVLSLCKCTHGHAVLNTFVEVMPAPATAFVVDEMTGQFGEIATHRNGCQVLQTIIMHGNAAQVETIAAELTSQTASLCRNEHGSLVVQCLLEYGSDACRADIVERMLPFIALFAMHKIASHVVEKLVDVSVREHMQRLVAGLVNSAQFSVADIACSRCGSALLREMADDDEHLNELRLPLWKAGARLDKSKYGRKVLSSFGLPLVASIGQDRLSLHCAALAA